jgi:bifunctional UDP-N-acetylglucosamine pyrophosphorylase/glucosamine-1-phosphate N-acetyltransferase
MSDSLAVAILAAGKGTRMKSRLPKVLHELGGRTLIEHVLISLNRLNPSRRLVIVGHQAATVQSALAAVPNLEFIEQSEQRGTGHALQQVIPALSEFQGELLVLSGDVPLLQPETLAQLLAAHRAHQPAATLLTAQLQDPSGYGRVFCDAHGVVSEIIEHADCTPEQRQNHQVNAGIYCFNWSALSEILPRLKADNEQQEYYLTDVFKDLSPVMAVDISHPEEILGINDRKQLAQAETILQQRVKDAWMLAGVTLINPDSITIEPSVQIEPDVIIEPQTHLRGQTVIRTGCRIGPGTLITDSTIGPQGTILYSVINDSTIAAGARIGPYTHFRGQVTVGEGCRIGNFVEVKNTTLGQNTNAAHLAYLGDATLGNRVNIGAGTITANYDGYQKHPSVIGDSTKTGANSVLVAPVTLGSGVTVGAGSVVTQNVPDNCLVVTRGNRQVIPNWQPRSVRQSDAD